MILDTQALRWRSLVICVIMAICIAWTPLNVAVAQPATPIDAPVEALDIESEVTVNFPVGIQIAADIAWDDDFGDAEVELLYTIGGDETASLVFVATDGALANGEMPVTATLDLQAQFIPSGVAIDFWWRVVDGAGSMVAESTAERTEWFDTRWDWQERQTDQVRVHTYAHSTGFVQEMLDAAQDTVTQLEQRYALPESAPLDIWVYPTLEDFREAQQPNSRESIAGASFPGYFLIVAVVPEGSTAEIGRVILHEVSHQVLYQATTNPFTYPPLWFDEGLATHFQVGGTDGYMETAIRALEDDALFNIEALSASFPFLPAQATLAYAASWSLVEYIEQTHGDAGVSALIAAFATGVPYDEALIDALGVDGDALNEDWRAWIADHAG